MPVAFRVYRIPASLKTAIKATREQNGETNSVLIDRAVANGLPGLVEALLATGLAPAGNTSPARFPLSESTLVALRKASAATTIPACQLLTLCLTTATAAAPKARKTRKGSK